MRDWPANRAFFGNVADISIKNSDADGLPFFGMSDVATHVIGNARRGRRFDSLRDPSPCSLLLSSKKGGISVGLMQLKG